MREVLKRSALKKKMGLALAFLLLAAPLLAPGAALAQEDDTPTVTVTGTVTDSLTGDVLPGANVLVKGTDIGTAAEGDGQFELQAPSLNETLVISFIGYSRKEVPMEGRSTIDIPLAPKSVTGEKVVVTAFGEEQEQMETVGSVTSVSTEELESVPSSNLTTALVGQASGMTGYQDSGEPGENSANFFIRGVSSFGYKKDPLIRIDGVEATTQQLARLRPEDIDSFTILKDATATSLYGSRAANGVILIKTKEGFDTDGDARISLRMETSAAMPTHEVELASPVTQMRLNNRAALTRDPLAQRPFLQEKIERTAALDGESSYKYPSINWKDRLFKDYSLNQRAILNVRGGGDVAQYYVSGSINQDNGRLEVPSLNNFNNNINLKNYSLRSNVNINLTESTNLKVRLNGSFDDYNGPIVDGDDVYRMVMHSSRVRFPAIYPSKVREFARHPLFGNYEGQTIGGGLMTNPYAQMVRGYREYSRSVMNAQLEGIQDLSFIAEGLQFSTMMNTERNSFFSLTRQYNPYYYGFAGLDQETNEPNLRQLNPESGTNYLDYSPQGKQVSTSFYLESKLEYDSTFSDRHTVSGLGVVTARHAVTGNAGSLQRSLPRRNLNFATSASYSYDDRYYVELNAAVNGSERFAQNHRFGFFPSVGVAWRISNEDFWEPVKSVVDNFRLRSTFGLSGNDQIASRADRFLYLSEVQLDDSGRGAQFGTEGNYSRPGVSISRYSNPRISWERSQKLNLGMDLGLFDRFDLSAEFFREYRSNILQERTAITASMGLQDTPQANLGAAINRGVELSANYDQSFGSKGWLRGRGNFTFAHSNYVEYEEYEYKDAPWRSRIGTSIGQRYGYIAERLFIDEKEVENSPTQFGQYSGGDIKFRDVNGDGQITTLDRVPLGYPSGSPEIVYGFGLSGGYGNFDASFFAQGAARKSFWIDPDQTAPFGADNTQMLKAYAEDHWSREDRDLYALWPRLSNGQDGQSNNTRTSTWFMRNGAFLRLKKAEIGYSLPENLRSWAAMEEARIYVSGSNLLLWSPFDLWDVEMGGNGLGYPLRRVINVGIDLQF